VVLRAVNFSWVTSNVNMIEFLQCQVR